MARLAAFAQMLFLQPQPLQHHACRSLLDLQFLAVLRGEGTSVLTDTKEINRKKILKITSFYLNSLFLLNAFSNLHNQTKCGRLEPEKDGSGGCAESLTVAWTGSRAPGDISFTKDSLEKSALESYIFPD